MSNPFSTPRSAGDSGHGFSWKPVFVRAIDKTNNVRVATCVDQFGNEISVRCDIMRAKGVLPEPGEHWILDHAYGQWIFGAILNGTTRGVEVSTVTDLPETLDDQFHHRPTGDIEMTWRTIAKPDSLLMVGQAISRTTYANLWAFANDQSLVGSVFGTGDGSTTFTLPDMRGRVLIGAGTLGSDTYTVGGLVGAARVTLATNQMPSHNHSVDVINNGEHAHNVGGSTDSQGAHSPHPAFPITVASGAGAANVWATSTATGQTLGAHTHSVSGVTSAQGDHDHTVTEATVGGTTPVDVRQPGIGVNWLIWV